MFDEVLNLYNLTSEKNNKDDFFLLHAVTSSTAVTSFLPYLNPEGVF